MISLTETNIKQVHQKEQKDKFVVISNATSLNSSCGITAQSYYGKYTETEDRGKYQLDLSSHTSSLIPLSSIIDNPCFYTQLVESKSSSSEFNENLELEAERIKKLVENGDISEARNRLLSIPFGVSNKLDNWRKVLAKPKARIEKSATGGNIKADILWLRNNSSKYKGKWVALKDGALLDSNENRIKLHVSLKQSDQLSDTTFFYIEA